MSERYTVNVVGGSHLEFDDKDPEVTGEYFIDFSPVIGSGLQIVDTPTVEIEAAGNAESPLELHVMDDSITTEGSPDATESPAPVAVVRFMLTDGSAGVRYRGKIKVNVGTEESPSSNRVLVKRFYVVVSLP